MISYQHVILKKHVEESLKISKSRPIDVLSFKLDYVQCQEAVQGLCRFYLPYIRDFRKQGEVGGLTVL